MVGNVVRLIQLCFLISIASLASADPSTDFNSNHLKQQRQAYLKAKKALDAGNYQTYQLLRQKLTDYPLLPYLDYREIHKQLAKLPYNDVDNFLYNYKEDYLGKLLLRQWLNLLASNNRWHEYRSYYLPTFNSARHECWYLWSRIKTGDRNALKEAERLWNVAVSQPSDCDPLFAEWRKAGYMTVDLLWERHRKALLKRQHRLARYLRKRMPDDIRALAIKFHSTLRNPASLADKASFKNNHPYWQDMVFKGLERYAGTDPDKAWRLWLDYQQYYSFNEEQVKSFYYRLVRKYASKGDEQAVLRQLNNVDNDRKGIVVETLLRSLLHQQNWQAVLNWVDRLPEADMLTDRWRYWQARASQALKQPRENYQTIYESLSQTRSFYGFLSADLLGKDYNLQHQPTTIDPQTTQSLYSLPGLQRARELFSFGHLHHARQEWKYATTGLSDEQYQAVAKLAYEWGWYRKSIESMAAAEAWNDLKIRFPIAHEDIVRQLAQQTKLPPTLIFAIARQESAWEPDARSRAGAMGLMQLLPRTARSTAAKVGLYHSKSALLQPKHNITLGSHYISELLNNYDNNRVPAIAAYNAGPSRVNRWLKKSDSQLPHDIWIESIPFNETRKYVQNVLSYAVVYAYRIGEQTTLLTKQESNNRL